MNKLLQYFMVMLPFLSQADDKINSILEKNNGLTRQINIAIQVKELNTGKEIYSLNPDRLMIPASTTKSFTAYSALEYLGPEFTYNTQILFDETKIDNNGVLSDNLYIKFSGDPSFTKDNFFKLISDLKKYNINSITGDIVIDDFIFDQHYQANGWSWDDSKFCFAAPTSAIVIDKNCFYLKLSPKKLSGFSVAKIHNDIITKNDPNCSPELSAHPDNSYNLTGCLDEESQEIPLSIAYQDPRLMLRALLKNYKQVVYNTTPPEYKVMLEHESLPLAKLLKQMHKTSDNIAADNFIKTIGAKYYKTQGSFANGTKAISEITANKEIFIFDGSGGSRYNLISPNHLVDLFIKAHNNQYFYDSLMTSGIDGVLEKRFIEKLNGRIHAKTGSMKGVTNLVGYLETDTGKILVFAIMINSCTDKKRCDQLTNEILEIIASI